MPLEIADIVQAGLKQLPIAERMALLMISILTANEGDALATTLEMADISYELARRFASTDIRAAFARKFRDHSDGLAAEHAVTTLH